MLACGLVLKLYLKIGEVMCSSGSLLVVIKGIVTIFRQSCEDILIVSFGFKSRGLTTSMSVKLCVRTLATPLVY